MFSRVKKFVGNHWKKVAVGAVAFQALSYGAKFATSKLVEYHEREASELWKKLKKEEHFNSIESNFSSSFTALLSLLRQSLKEHFDREGIVERMKGGVSKEEKIKLWEQLKINSFVVVIVTIYGSAILSILLRIQLSIIGGYLFIESNEVKEQKWRNVEGVILSNSSGIDTELQQKFLSLSQNFTTVGVRSLFDSVSQFITPLLSNLQLSQNLTLTQLERLFLSLTHSNLDSNPLLRPSAFIFPPFSSKEPSVRPHWEPPDMYESLLIDAHDLLSSEDVQSLLRAFGAQGVSHFCDRIADSFPPPSSSSSSTPCEQNELFREGELSLAKIIPLLSSLVRTGGGGADPWLSLLLQSESSKTFGANVYESFSLIF